MKREEENYFIIIIKHSHKHIFILAKGNTLIERVPRLKQHKICRKHDIFQRKEIRQVSGILFNTMIGSRSSQSHSVEKRYLELYNFQEIERDLV
jgi:hypothetical protein